MMKLNLRSRHRKRLLWTLLALVVASAVWILNVVLTYERNVRHIPTQFRLRTHERPYNWRA
jgi:hypothetical protein